MGRMVTSRARRWTNRFFESLENYPVTLEELSPLLRAGSDYSDEIAAALMAEMDSDDDGTAVAAAWGVLVASKAGEPCIDDDSVTKAQRLVKRVLDEGPDDLKMISCYLLSLEGVRPMFLPALACLLGHSNREVAFFAASAIALLEPGNIAAYDVMRREVERNEEMAGLAAAYLHRADPEDKHVVEAMCSWLLRPADVGTYAILLVMRQVGSAIPRLCRAVAGIVADEQAHPRIRQVAAKTLGKIGRDLKYVSSALSRALQSPEPLVIDGAIEGFKECGVFPPGTAERLVSLLEDPRAEMRGTAALGLAAMKEGVQPVLESVVERFGEERNVDVSLAIATAIGASGSTAVSTLIRIIRQGDVRAEFAMRALSRLGRDAAVTIAKTLKHVNEEGTRKSLVLTLLSMGADAQPAMECVAEVLSETESDEDALYMAMGLYGCSSVAAPALPALIGCIIDDRAEEVRDWAERAIGAMGRQGIEAVQEAVRASEGNTKCRLEAMLARLSALDDARFKDFENLNRDDLLKMFMHVADLITRHKKIGFAKMEKELEPLQESLGFSISESRLREGVCLLEEVLQVKLIERSAGRQRGLGRDAPTFLAKIAEYFRVKEQRLGQNG